MRPSPALLSSIELLPRSYWSKTLADRFMSLPLKRIYQGLN